MKVQFIKDEMTQTVKVKANGENYGELNAWIN